jgi:hypothetical protein
MPIESINQRVVRGSTSLHVASYYGHIEIVQLLLDAGASAAIRNVDHGLTAYEEARTQSTKDLFRRYRPARFAGNSLHIEWSSTFQNPLKKRKYIRERMTRNFASWQNNATLSEKFKLVAANLSAYVLTLAMSKIDQKRIDNYISKFAELCNPTFLLKAYMSTTSFYKYLNQDIAMHSLDYFDPFTVDLSFDYKVIKTLMNLVAIFMNYKEFANLKFQGKTYRGMLITEEDLYKHVVNSKIMNKSFLSTSKDKNITTFFNGNDDSNTLRKTPDNKPIHLCALCKYVVKNSDTALDIHSLSEEEQFNEQEVLILPFCVFKVISVKRLNNNKVKIELEECESSSENY